MLLAIPTLLSFLLPIPYSAMQDAEEAKITAALEGLRSLAMEVSYTARVDDEKSALSASVVMVEDGRVAVRVRRDNKEIAGWIVDGLSVTEWDGQEKRWTRYRIEPEAQRDSGRLWRRRWDTHFDLAHLATWYAESWVKAPCPYNRYLQEIHQTDEHSWRRDTVAGRTCDVASAKQVQREGPVTLTEVMRLAYDADSHMPLIEEITTRGSTIIPFVELTGANKRWRHEYERIQLNPTVDDDGFDYDAPADYEFVDPKKLEPPVSSLIGKSAADWKFSALDGGPIDPMKEPGTLGVVLVGWATWCRPCKAELKHLAELQKDDEFNRQWKVIAVNLDKTPQRASAFLKESPMPFTVAYDPDFIKRVGAGVPTTVIIDREGIIRALWTGWGAPGGDEHSQRQLQEALQKAGASE